MINYGRQYIDDEDIKAVNDVLLSDYLTTGPKVENFEKNLLEYTGGAFCAVCSNGTSALHLSYLALGLGKGDEVITTANTFVATSNMIIACGSTPVFCDISMEDYNIDVDKIEELITPKTKAITVVHFAGRPCNMNYIWKLAKKYNIKVIEDAAHALGASYDSVKIGATKSDLITFSFHPVKPITTGEGGAVITKNKEYYEKILKFRSHGIIKDDNGLNDMVELGYNYRITDIQCALGISQLKKVNSFIKYRKEIFNLYKKYLSGISGLKLPKDDDISISGCHLYVIKFNKKGLRDIIMEKLRKTGYGVTLHYPPVYSHTYYRNNGYRNINLINSEEFYNTCLSLPVFYKLNKEKVKEISKIIIDSIGRY